MNFEKLSLVPQKPGVYLMRDESGTIIYIGKAKSLKSRLSSYFKMGSYNAKVTAMLGRVCDFDYFVTRSENDALGLEANLIKKHKPHYNILLKDSKSFPYIKITDGDWPCLEITRRLSRGGKYFGPYFNGIWARELLDTLRDIFPLRTCSNAEFSKAKKNVPCINHQIERCYAPCAGKITKEEYQKIIADVKAFLRGEREFGAREKLTSKMEIAAQLEQFEVAIRYRNGINFLDKLKERTITQIGRDVNCDIFAHVIGGDIFVASVLTVRAGKLIGVQNFSDHTQGVESDDETLGSFIMQFYQSNIVPEQIIAEIPLDEVAEILGCHVFNPKIALKRQLLDMAKTNAQEYLDTSVEKIKFKHEFTVGATGELREILGMGRDAKRIECFDISHTGGEDTVASMVVFVDGVANKKLYRRFKIKHLEGNNDVMSMQEVIKRRIARIGTEDESFGVCPDLIVIDGGKGQLGAACDVLQKLPLTTPVSTLTTPSSLRESTPSKEGEFAFVKDGAATFSTKANLTNCVSDLSGNVNSPSLEGVAARSADGVVKGVDGVVYGLDIREIAKIRNLAIIAFSENDEIFVRPMGEPIVLGRRSYALRLLQRVRDEAHRFANEYHKKVRDLKISRKNN